MAIAISVSNTSDIETRTGLIAFITNHLELDSESAAEVDSFIRLAEARMNRLIRDPRSDASTALATVASEEAIALPTDFRQMIGLKYTGDVPYDLQYVDHTTLDDLYKGSTGVPTVFTVHNGSIYLGPTPDGVYSLRLDYMAKIPNLSTSNETNWLLTNYVDLYVYATLWHAAAWLEDPQAAAAFKGLAMEIIDEINYSGNLYRNATPLRLRSSVVV